MTTNQSKYIILYADDDPDDRRFLTEALDVYSEHVTVITFPDGAKAVAYLENLAIEAAAPCLIILDINMPRLNGKEALSAIRSMQRFRDTPVVLFTTSSLSLDKAFATRHDAGLITKPVKAEETLMIADRFIRIAKGLLKPIKA